MASGRRSRHPPCAGPARVDRPRPAAPRASRRRRRPPMVRRAGPWRRAGRRWRSWGPSCRMARPCAHRIAARRADGTTGAVGSSSMRETLPRPAERRPRCRRRWPADGDHRERTDDGPEQRQGRGPRWCCRRSARSHRPPREIRNSPTSQAMAMTAPVPTISPNPTQRSRTSGPTARPTTTEMLNQPPMCGSASSPGFDDRSNPIRAASRMKGTTRAMSATNGYGVGRPHAHQTMGITAADSG